MVDSAYHRALAVQAVLDLLYGGAGSTLSLRWHGQVLDYVATTSGAIQFVRAKAGSRSRVVSSDLWMALRDWSGVTDVKSKFMFRSEAALYPTAEDIVAARLERFASDRTGEEDLKAVRAVGLDPSAPCLRRTRIVIDPPSSQMTDQILRRLEVHCEEWAVSRKSAADLFWHVLAFGASSQGRTLAREEALACLSLDVL